ncbi:GrpB family protein [Enterococcus sp. LJL90]
MLKDLSEMSLAELWELFPIVLTEHQDVWDDWYKDEKSNLEEILSDFASFQITHIGSTAIPNIWAKPIIDILIEFNSDSDIEKAKDKLETKSYIVMSQSTNRISLNKGYTNQGFAKRVFHIHLRLRGDNDEIYFKKYLIKFPEVAKKYEKLKLSLKEEYEHNRDAYTEAKGKFILENTKKARELFS